jgi:hypothetical protein
MGDILGLEVTHYPPLTGRDENMAGMQCPLRKRTVCRELNAIVSRYIS